MRPNSSSARAAACALAVTWATLAGCTGGNIEPESEGEAATRSYLDAGAARDGASAPHDVQSVDERDDASPPTVDDDPSCGVLHARVRDFKQAHGDFEDTVNGRVVTGLVAEQLGADGTPQIIASVADAEGIHSYSDWYHDVSGVNEGVDVVLTLVEQPDGKRVFDSDAFFPIDGKGFGNEYYEHNYHFTTEINTRFVYRGGELFTFSGDDDVWVFINRRLALDLGGVHGRESSTVDLDAQRDALGIALGGEYTMDVFHAERHLTGSNFRIETTIECITPVIVI